MFDSCSDVLIRKRMGFLPGAHKKSSSGKSEELIYKKVVSYGLTYLSPLLRSGVGTLYILLEHTGCQGFSGPFPQPFLISDV